MLGFSGRTRRLPFAMVITICYFGNVILTATKPLITGISTLSPDAAAIVGTIAAIVAIVWTASTGFAWLVFSVRRLRDAGWHPALAVVSVVLGFINDPSIFVDITRLVEMPWGIWTTLLCFVWVLTLIALPSRDRSVSTQGLSRQGIQSEANKTRRQFGLR